MNDYSSKEQKNQLKQLLKNNSRVQVDFTKVNGEKRTMTCTLKDTDIQPYIKKTDRVKVDNEDVLRVWDVNKQEWRGFRYESINHVVVE